MSDIKYKAYVTDLGKEKIAAALAEGTQVQITHMVVGDGTVDEPTADITELIGEGVWRGPVNSVAAKADDPNIIIIEVMVPGTVGGFWMREYACLDQDGEMIAWASMPPSYKTVPADGAIKSYALNMHIAVADSAAINLELGDDSVAASKQDIIDVRVEIEAARDAAADALAEHNEDPGVHPTFARKSDLEGLGASPATTAPPAVGTAAVGSSEDYARGDHNHALPGTVVLTSGAQTIAGAKTFSSNVIVPATPTANTHATSKQYVDAALAGKANLSALDATRSAIETIENKLSGENLALGKDAAASITGIVIGAESSTNSSHAIVVGNSASSTSAGGSVTIGYTASSGASGSIATGSIAIGQAANCAKGYSVALGFNTRISGEYSTALGPQASIAESDSGVMQLGSTSSMYLSALRCRVGLSQTSDERDKADIAPISAALDFIQQVQPIQYVDNARVKYLPPEEERTAEQQELMRKYGLCRCYDEQAHAAGQQKGERKRVGVSAQQVQDALAAVYGSADYANIVNDNLHDVAQREELPEGVESQLTVNYSGFVPFLIQAVQELARRVEELEARSM